MADPNSSVGKTEATRVKNVPLVKARTRTSTRHSYRIADPEFRNSTQLESVGQGDGTDRNGITCRVQLAFDHNFVPQILLSLGALNGKD